MLQVPHESEPPQPSPAEPQLMPRSPQVLGTQDVMDDPHCEGTPPPPQDSPDGQLPHESVPPQPSPAGPQAIDWSLHVRGEQMAPPSGSVGVPHSLCFLPPPHVSGDVHDPQLRVPPHPSPAGPQEIPRSLQVVGLHAPLPPHWLNLPPPPHVSGDLQVPHSILPPQPSPVGPQV
jgi:hypothetical protein